MNNQIMAFKYIQECTPVYDTISENVLLNLIKCSSNCARCDWTVRVHYKRNKKLHLRALLSYIRDGPLLFWRGGGGGMKNFPL